MIGNVYSDRGFFAIIDLSNLTCFILTYINRLLRNVSASAWSPLFASSAKKPLVKVKVSGFATSGRDDERESTPDDEAVLLRLRLSKGDEGAADSASCTIHEKAALVGKLCSPAKRF